jgi:hypothetical protein
VLVICERLESLGLAKTVHSKHMWRIVLSERSLTVASSSQCPTCKTLAQHQMRVLYLQDHLECLGYKGCPRTRHKSTVQRKPADQRESLIVVRPQKVRSKSSRRTPCWLKQIQTRLMVTILDTNRFDGRWHLRMSETSRSTLAISRCHRVSRTDSQVPV